MRLVPRLTFVIVSIALAAMMVTTAFAQTALPGQPLYSLKISSERVWRAAAPDHVAVDISIANRRADELLQLAEKNPKGNASQKIHVDAEEQGIAAYTDALDRLSTDVNGPDETVILTVLEAHQQKFDHAGIRVPKLDDIVKKSQHGQGQGQDPSGNKP